MKPIVPYTSKGFNTGKIAVEIAKELNCGSLRITQSSLANSVDLDNYDLIFIGTGIHFGNPNEDLISYLNRIKLINLKFFAIFLTWFGAGKVNQYFKSKLKSVLESNSQKVIEDCFVCLRWMDLLRRGHPNSEDAQDARNWAKRTSKHQPVASFS